MALLVVFGLLTIWRRPFELVATRLSGLFVRAHALANRAGPDNGGGLGLGMIMGALWTPCAVMRRASSRRNDHCRTAGSS